MTCEHSIIHEIHFLICVPWLDYLNWCLVQRIHTTQSGHDVPQLDWPSCCISILDARSSTWRQTVSVFVYACECVPKIDISLIIVIVWNQDSDCYVCMCLLVVLWLSSHCCSLVSDHTLVLLSISQSETNASLIFSPRRKASQSVSQLCSGTVQWSKPVVYRSGSGMRSESVLSLLTSFHVQQDHSIHRLSLTEEFPHPPESNRSIHVVGSSPRKEVSRREVGCDEKEIE